MSPAYKEICDHKLDCPYIQEAFNAGARFGSGSEVRIPPPPPGVAPNAAQFAQAMGQNVVLGQKRSKFL